MSEWTENVDSVPENVRSYVSRCLVMAECHRLFNDVDRLAASAIGAGDNIERAKHQMAAALNEALDIISERKKVRAA